MVQILVILAFLAARSGGSVQPHADGWRWAAFAPCLVALAGWLGVAAAAARAGRILDATGRIHVLDRVYGLVMVVRVGSLAALFAGVTWWGWADWVRGAIGSTVLVDELLIVAPVIAVIVLTWWSVEPLERRLRDASLFGELMDGRPIQPHVSRTAWVWTQVCHHMLLVLVPICLLQFWGETVEAFWPAHWREWIEAAQWCGTIAILLLTPFVIRHLWDAVPLGSGQMRDDIVALLRLYKVRVGSGGPLVWQTHRMVVNGAILGVLPPFRYLLLTDALLDGLSRQQLDVVLAHEIAHVKRQHILWIAAAVLGSAICALWLCLAALGLLQADDAVWREAPVFIAAAAGILALGFVSRTFEREADAFAMLHVQSAAGSEPRKVSPEAAHAAVSTLQAVAELNGTPVTRPDFRHGSILHRQRALLGMVGRPLHRLPIMRRASIVRWAAGLMFVLAVVLIALSAMQEAA